ncbi:MAG: Ig-like domain-containing protein [Acutalibacteraceae bacterium]|nr:Ig-like domain-containing protein [Acutalibacteraceae bacterium]
MKGKKFLAILMSALILSATAVCSTSVSAYENNNTVLSEANPTFSYKTGENTFYYELSDNKVNIIMYYGPGKNVVIPDEIDGKPVTKISPFAFAGVERLVSVTIPKTVTQITNDVFNQSYDIKEFNVDSENSNYTSVDGVLYNKDKTLLICYPPSKEASSFTIPSTVKKIAMSAFLGNKNLESVKIPEGVTELDNNAFYGCEKLKSVSLPDSITYMGSYAFNSCPELTTAKLSKNSFISIHAFAKCTKLKNVTIPEGVEVIYSAAFWDCIALNEIKLPSTLKEIRSYAFATTPMKSIVIPESVTIIEKNAIGYDNSKQENIKDFVIYGYKGTEAERYATISGLSFSTMDSPAQVVKLNKESIKMGVNENYTLKPTLLPENTTTTYKWKSSNTSVATVNSNGKITAKAEGTADITVETADGCQATCKITVKKAPTSVSLNKSSITLGAGEQFDFNSSLSQGSASYSTVYSSSNPNVVSVKAGGGLATGKTPGTATITVKTYNGKTATCKVTVKKAPTSVSLNKTSATLGIGEKIDLNSKMPTGEASRVVAYTSADTSIATVDGSGVVTAKKTGTVTITAKTYNGKTATCKITVKKAPTSVSLNKASATLGIGEKIDLNSKMPTGEASRVVTYTSADTSIATVDGSGVVTAKKTGTVTITAKTYNGKTATCKITVKKAPTSVSLNKTSATLGIGEKIDLNSKMPSGQASRVVTYTSADTSIATVDSSGVVTAKKTGTVTITAKTYNGKTATCKITVKKAPTSVSLNYKSKTLAVGQKVDLNSKMPSGEASRVVTYTSADTSIATVDSSGVVTAKKKGTVIITAKTYNGKTTTCKITVK